jgi:hypothetical protein
VEQQGGPALPPGGGVGPCQPLALEGHNWLKAYFVCKIASEIRLGKSKAKVHNPCITPHSSKA